MEQHSDIAARGGSIGRRLRSILTLNRMSVREFAGVFAIPYRTMNQYLNDRAKPGADVLQRLAAGGISVEWLLTGALTPGVALDLSDDPEMAPASGNILADQELSELLFAESVFLVDELVAERPALAGKLGLVGQFKSVWNIFSEYAASFERVADQVEKARRAGWSTDDIAAIVTGGLRDKSRAQLRSQAAQLLGEVSDAPTTSVDAGSAPRSAA